MERRALSTLFIDDSMLSPINYGIIPFLALPEGSPECIYICMDLTKRLMKTIFNDTKR